jgi:hypothetical protein
MTTLPKTWLELAREGKASVDEVWSAFTRARKTNIESAIAGLFKPGQSLSYDDGRAGHRQVKATVLSVGPAAMVVQFEDRADTTTIRFSDSQWTKFIHLHP